MSWPDVAIYQGWIPADNGLLTATGDPDAVNIYGTGNSFAPVSGTIYARRVKFGTNPTTYVSASALWTMVGTAGAGLTGIYLGAYDTNGSLLGVSAESSGLFTGTTGNKSIACSLGLLQGGMGYLIAFLAVGTTPPQLKASAAGAQATNLNLAAPSLRFAVLATGQTTMPATVTLGNITAPTGLNAPWFGVS